MTEWSPCLGFVLQIHCIGVKQAGIRCMHDDRVGSIDGFIGMQVTLNLESKASHTRKQGQAGADYKRQKSGHAFSANTPYGKKNSGEQRQFARK